MTAPAREPTPRGSSPQVKICGLTRPEDAAWAAQCGATYLGVILVGGPRLVTERQATALFSAPDSPVHRVGVLGRHTRDEMARLADALSLDVLQLHEAPTPADVAWLASRTGCRIWPVIRIGAAGLPAEAEALASAAGALLLDALVPGQLGGTGVTLPWEALAAPLTALRHRMPATRIILAGGLTPLNVASAVDLLLPEGVDVSSGVEVAPGVKDPARVAAFVRAAVGSRRE